MRLPEDQRAATIRIISERLDKDFYVWREFAQTQARASIGIASGRKKNEYILDFAEERDAVLFKLWCM